MSLFNRGCGGRERSESSNGFHETVAAFKQESGQAEFQPDPKAKWSGLLEKKWTSVIRLQKKVRLTSLSSQLLLANSS